MTRIGFAPLYHWNFEFELIIIKFSHHLELKYLIRLFYDRFHLKQLLNGITILSLTYARDKNYLSLEYSLRK